MENTVSGALDGAEKRTYAETLIGAYPDISNEELELIVRWYRKEASALDIGLLAQNERIREGYERFRADHIDKFKPRDIGTALVLLIVTLGVMGGIVYLSL